MTDDESFRRLKSPPPEAYTKVSGGITPEQQEALHRLEREREKHDWGRAQEALRRKPANVRRLRDDTPAALLEDVLALRPGCVAIAWIGASGQIQVQAVANDAQWSQLLIAMLATGIRWQLEEAVE